LGVATFAMRQTVHISDLLPIILLGGGPEAINGSALRNWF
jgi:hypothetical protein